MYLYIDIQEDISIPIYVRLHIEKFFKERGTCSEELAGEKRYEGEVLYTILLC